MGGGLTVNIPADAASGHLDGVVDSFQDCLEFLFLGDLRLRHLRHVQLLALQLLCGPDRWGECRRRATALSQKTPDCQIASGVRITAGDSCYTVTHRYIRSEAYSG